MTIEKQPCIYIISNYKRTVLYTGVTSNLTKRIGQHKEGAIAGFSQCYQCKDLLYYELAQEMTSAIVREKQIKAYRREKKELLINSINPNWRDLYDEIL